jgi:hypothetical protein
MEDYHGLLGPLWRTIGWVAPSTSGGVLSTRSPNHGRLGLGSACVKKKIGVRCLGWEGY